ncbi:MAG: histone deacetylase [Candidatus Hydrothermarchaeota archaeon]
MIVYTDRYLVHDLPTHPENAQRLKAIMAFLEKDGFLDKVRVVEPLAAGEEEILRVHTRAHLEHVQRASAAGEMLDPDTYTTPQSYEVALLAVGGVLRGIKEGGNSFAIVRPPGHHAEGDRAMGFCLFNNVAVGAMYALEEMGIKRVFILDYDVHHGNGTQKAFYSDPRVLYASLHQAPLYPGTGRMEEVGAGEGEGFNINAPLPPGTGDRSYLRALEEVVLPAASQFRPELILCSAGYDGHHRDPLGGLLLTAEAYRRISELLLAFRVPVVMALEGGYSLEALPLAVEAAMGPLFGLDAPREREVEESPGAARVVEERIMALMRILAPYY